MNKQDANSAIFPHRAQHALLLRVAKELAFPAKPLRHALSAAGGTPNYISQRAKDLRAGAPGKRQRPSPSQKLAGHSHTASAGPYECSAIPAPGVLLVCVPSLQDGLMGSQLRFDRRVVLVTGAGGGEHSTAGGRAPLPGPGIRAQPQLRSQRGVLRPSATGGGKKRLGELGTGPGGAGWEDVGPLLSGRRLCCGGRGGAAGLERGSLRRAGVARGERLAGLRLQSQ